MKSNVNMIILVIQKKKKGRRNVFVFHSHFKSKSSLGVTNLHEIQLYPLPFVGLCNTWQLFDPVTKVPLAMNGTGVCRSEDKTPFIQLLDRIRLLGSLVARETVYPMHLYVIAKIFPTPDLCSPVVEGTKYTTDVRSQLPQDSTLPQICYLILWKHDSSIQD